MKCSGYLTGISERDLRRSCRCHWMQPIVPLAAYREKPPALPVRGRPRGK